MNKFPCPYLKGTVELTQERERHIAERHPDLLPEYRKEMIETLAQPEQIRRSKRFGNAKLFSRWYTDVKKGKYVVVVVVSESDAMNRHWIITAYLTRRLVEGEVEWKRN
jgi:hypothetical protein